MRSLLRCSAYLCLFMLVTACASSPAPKPALPPDIDPNDPLAGTLLMQQGQMLVAQGKIAEGMEKYKVTVQLQPDNPTVYNLIGMAELQKGDNARAIESFNKALMLAPKYSDARNNRAAAYVQLGQYAMAETDFLSVLADDTYANRAGVYFNLGSLYFARGNLAGAEENLRRATRGAGPVEAYFMLGEVEEKLGKSAAAESSYREAMSRAPERADIILGLAKFLVAHGRRDEARTLLHRIIELAPNSPEARQARTMVE
jgi:Flp pilus assembly protein TadD